MPEIIELMVSTAVEPQSGISDKGLELIKSSIGSTDFLTPGVTVALVSLVALAIGSVFLT